jgi:hypothetical protein
MNERVLGIPVSPVLPEKHKDCERETVTISLDEDLILHVFGKGATQQRGARALPCEDFQTFSARRRICSSVSASGRYSGKVSSAEMDLLTRFGTTGLWSIPRAS